MLNIGKLRADAVNYYVGAVAPTTADYYFGRGESPGRWAGSLAPKLGLAGKVEREAIEALLKGLDPGSGAELVTSAGSNARAMARSETRAAPRQGGAIGLEVAQVAAQLQVSTRAVRHWIDAGEVAKDLLRDATPAEVPLQSIEDYQARLDDLAAKGESPEGLPPSFLLAERFSAAVRGGHRYRWAITQHSVDRLSQQRRPPDARAGWDLVFRPPKSYSVLWAVGHESLRHDLQAIHHEATADALSYLEDTAATARTTAEVGTGRKRVRTATDGLVVAAFDHRDSRAGDPLLHTHCVVANLTRLADGSWAALDPHGLYRQGLAADAVYQSSFRHLAERRLGLATEPVVNGWADVEGVPRAVVEHFSKRSEEIAAELARVGSDSPAARQIAAVASRRAKAADREADGLHERWRAEAAEVGFDAAAVSACLGRTTGAEVDDVRIEALFDRLGGASGLTEEAATFSRADVVCALATALGGAVPGPRLVVLADRFLAGDRAVQVREHRPGMPRHRLLEGAGKGFVDDLANAAFTTPELATIEARLMAVATDSHRWQGPVVPQSVIEAALARRPKLAEEQRDMVRAVCGQPGVLRPVVGYPGSGKTYATEACVSVLTAAGVPVVGCAVTAVAADELARATGLAACDTAARTLADLEHPEFGGLAPATVVILDEASTIGHRDLDRLVSHVKAAGGALVMVGDPRQHGPVGPGHFFGWLVDREGAEVPTLRANHRQADVVDGDGEVVVSLAAEREANVAFREGRIAESLARRDDAGLVTRAATAAELYDIVVDEWLADWQGGARDPMVTTRNAVRHDLNLRARRLLVEAGHVSGPALEAAGRRFQVGDYVVARANNRRLRSADDATWWLKNGSRGTVVAVDTDVFQLAVDFEGVTGTTQRVVLPTSYLSKGHLEWAYAVTDYGVQGRTLDRSRAVVDDTTTAAGAYVATTRGRLENRLYLVDGSVAEKADHDTSHGPPPLREMTFDALAARLADEVPKRLIHESDPWVAAGGQLAASLALRELEILLAPLVQALAAAPPDVSRRIAGAEAAYDALAARHRVLVDRLAAAEDPTRRRGRATQDSVGALRADVAGVARSLDTLAGRLISLRAQAAHRQRFLAEHDEQVKRRDLLRDAIAGRATKVRLAAPAMVPAQLASVLPEPPASATSSERKRWRNAVEQAALYLDRWGPAAAGPGPGAITVAGTAEATVPGLGARPDGEESCPGLGAGHASCRRGRRRRAHADRDRGRARSVAGGVAVVSGLLKSSSTQVAGADGRDQLDDVEQAVAQAVAASDLLAACEAGWAAIQSRHPEVPDTVVVLGTGVERGRLVKLGHWWGGQWRVGDEARGEVLLAGEALHLPPEAVFEVLLHEAAHGLAASRGIRDTSRGGRYHNARFKAVAAEVGLRPRRMDPYAWARTVIQPATVETYAAAIAAIRAEMRLTRGLPTLRSIGAEGGVEGIGGSGKGAEEGDSNDKNKAKQRSAECGCEPGRKLRMAPSVLEQGPVICGVCGSEFTLPNQAEVTLVGSTRADVAPWAGIAGSRPTAGVDLRTIELPQSEPIVSQATQTTAETPDQGRPPGEREASALAEAAVPTAEAAP